MVFGKIQKPFCPSKVLGVFQSGESPRRFPVRGKSSAFSSPGKVLGAFCPGITATKIWFFEKPKIKPVLVYLHPCKNKLTYEKRIHHLTELMSVWYEIL